MKFRALFLALALCSSASFAAPAAQEQAQSTSQSASVAPVAKMKVNGLVCSFCAQGLTKAFKAHPQTQDVFVSLEDKLVAVQFKPDQSLSDKELKEIITSSGYTLVDIQRGGGSLDQFKKAP